MKRKCFVYLLCFITYVIVFPLTSLGKNAPYKVKFTSEENVSIKADTMYYDQANNVYFAEGNVIIIRGNATLKADKVNYNTVTQDAKAIGTVSLTEGEDILNCERLDINLDTRIGTISQARLFIKDNNYHITGQTFQKLGENRYRVLNGTVTTCNQEVPDWKITGGEIDVTVEGFASIKNSTFRIKNIPILYFPYFLYPVKIARQSGLLIPDFNYSTSDGFEMDNAFFWAISRNTDATFYLDYSSEKGTGGGLEFRYVLNERSKGKFYNYFIEERRNYFEDEYDPKYDRERKRMFSTYEGEHYFNDTSYTKARIDLLSDRKIYKDYGKEIRRSQSKWDRVSLRSREKDKSFIFYTKNWSQYSLVAETNYYKDLVKSDDTTLQRVPKISFTGARQMITGTPLFFKIDSSYDHFQRNEGVDGYRADFFPKLSLPLNFNNYLKFTPEVGVRGVAGFGLSKNSDYDKTKGLLDANAELSTTILKVYHFPGTRISKLKHSIEPSVFFQHITDNNQDEFPFFEPMDRFYKRSALTYALTNRFTAKILQPDGNVIERELGYFKISQNYYYTHPEWTWASEGYNGNDFSDLMGELRITFTDYAFFKGHLYYNPYQNSLSFYDFFMLVEDKRGDSLRFDYRYAKNELEGYRIESRFKITRSLFGFYESHRSEYNNKTLDSYYGFEYFAQCWSIKFSVDDKAKQDGRDRETEYSVLFNLAGLGKLGEVK